MTRPARCVIMEGVLLLTGSDLNVEDVVRVARGGHPVSLHEGAIARLREARSVVERALARDDEVYGLTTGVGAQKSVRLSPENLDDFNRRLIAEHRVGAGPLAAPDVVRAAMLVLANQLVLGYAGVRAELVDVIISALNKGRTPQVRSLGSIGQADLATLADLAAGLVDGFPLAPGEGLALIDNNAFTTGAAALAVHDAGVLLESAELAAAASLDAFGANLDLLHPHVGLARPLPGLRESLERLRAHLHGSRLWDPARARNLQDPLSFRTLPQVLGAARETLRFAGAAVTAELNASQGNPMVVVEEERLVAVGNFDASSLAAALDFARIGLAPALTVSAERTTKLLDSQWSGLPTGLGGPGEGTAGLSMIAIASQAHVTEARLLAQPVSFELASSSLAAGIEDRTSLAPLGARRLVAMVELGSRVVAAELAVAARAATLRGQRPLGVGTEQAITLVHEHASSVLEGAVADLATLAETLMAGAAT